MKLETKSTLVVTASTVAISILVCIIFWRHISAVIEVVEHDSYQRMSSHIYNSLLIKLDNQFAIMRDWAVWDDSLDFIKKKNRAYIDSNLAASTLENIDVTGLLYLDRGLDIYHEFALPEDEAQFHALAVEVTRQKRIIMDLMQKGIYKGLIEVPEIDKVAALTFHPIMNSNEDTDTSEGFLLFARFVDRSYVSSSSDTMGLTVDVDNRCDTRGFESTTLTFGNAPLLGQITFPTHEDARFSVALPTLNGRRVVCLHSSDKRVFKQHLVSAISKSLWIAVLIAGVALCIHLSMMHYMIVNPISKAIRVFGSITQKGDLTQRLAVNGSDELASLARSANMLLDSMQASNERLRQLSIIDGLTGLYNRTELFRQINEEYARAKRDKYPIGLLMIDVDFFKNYNDLYGHQEGDKCLALMAHVLSKSANRPGDVVGRYGGEEFIILLCNTDAAGTKHLGDAIVKRIAALGIAHAASDAGVVTCSIGGTCLVPTGKESVSSIISEADLNLYEVKKSGRNAVLISALTDADLGEV